MHVNQFTVLQSEADDILLFLPLFKYRRNPLKHTFGAPGGTRTHNSLIKSQLLYQLSYRGEIIFVFHREQRIRD